MPELKKLETSAAFTPAEGNIVEYFSEEDGEIVLKVKKSDGTEVALSGGTDTSDATVTAADVSKGLIFYGSAGRGVGTMPDAAATVTENVVTVPAGRIRKTQTVTVPASSGLSVSGDKVTVGKGYISEDSEVTVQSGSVVVDTEQSKVIVSEGYVDSEEIQIQGGGDTTFYKCAAVYGPRKVLYVTVSGAGTGECNGRYFLTDEKTSSGGWVYKHEGAEYYYYVLYEYLCIDDNYNTYGEEALYYSNDGSSWYTGYDWGTDSPTGASPAPTVSGNVATVDGNVPKTWDGYEAVLTGGVYSFSPDITTGLLYGDGYKPAVGNSYNNGCTIMANLYAGMSSGAISYLPFSTSLVDQITGSSPISTIGSPALSDGWLEFPEDQTSALTYPAVIGASAQPDEFSITFKAKVYAYRYNGSAVLFGNEVNESQTSFISFSSENTIRIAGQTTGGTNASLMVSIPLNTETACALTYSKGIYTFYVNGIAAATISDQSQMLLSRKLWFGGFYGYNLDHSFAGSLKDFRIFNRALSAEEIEKLAE